MSDLDRQLVVALKYIRSQDDVPRVVAKGRGVLARRILQLAKEHNVPVHRDEDLVEVLIKLDLGDPIPPELYKVVSEILAYVYTMNAKAKNLSP